MDLKTYVICYKETTTNTDGICETKSGVFDYGFTSFDEAKKSLVDVAQHKVDEFDDDTQEKITESWNDYKGYVCIGYLNDTYEYYIYMVTINDFNI